VEEMNFIAFEDERRDRLEVDESVGLEKL